MSQYLYCVMQNGITEWCAIIADMHSQALLLVPFRLASLACRLETRSTLCLFACMLSPCLYDCGISCLFDSMCHAMVMGCSMSMVTGCLCAVDCVKPSMFPMIISTDVWTHTMCCAAGHMHALTSVHCFRTASTGDLCQCSLQGP